MSTLLELWHTLEHAIVHYTGLSAPTFFTVLVVALTFYYVVSGWFAPLPPPARKREAEIEEMEPLPPPEQLGEITAEELSAYDGADPKKPLLMAIKGQIYDVTQSRMFYGPGGPYALFAGKDASRALAKMSFEQKDLTGDISGLGPFEVEALQDWEYKFMGKYVKVGTVKKEVPVTDGGETSEAAEASSTQTSEHAVPDTAASQAETSEDAAPVTVVSHAEHVPDSKEDDTPVSHIKSEDTLPEPKEAESEKVSVAEDMDIETKE